MQKLKTVKLIALVFVSFSLILITSCGDDGGGDSGPSDQEVLIELLNGNTFSTTSDSGTDAVGVDVTAVSVSFSGGATMNFTVTGGDIDVNAVSGGSFSISESGTLSDLAVTAADNVEVTPESISYNSSASTVSISFSTAESAARIGGIGSFDLVFDVGAQ